MAKVGYINSYQCKIIEDDGTRELRIHPHDLALAGAGHYFEITIAGHTYRAKTIPADAIPTNPTVLLEDR